MITSQVYDAMNSQNLKQSNELMLERPESGEDNSILEAFLLFCLLGHLSYVSSF